MAKQIKNKYLTKPLQIHPVAEQRLEYAILTEDYYTHWLWSILILRDDLYDVLENYIALVSQHSKKDNSGIILELEERLKKTHFYKGLSKIEKRIFEKILFIEFMEIAFTIVAEKKLGKKLHFGNKNFGIHSSTNAKKGTITLEVDGYISKTNLKNYIEEHWLALQEQAHQESLGTKSIKKLRVRDLQIYNKVKELRVNGESTPEAKTTSWAEQEFTLKNSMDPGAVKRIEADFNEDWLSINT